MKPTIIGKGELILLGMNFYGDPFESSAGWTEDNEIGRLWNRFMAHLKKCGFELDGVKDKGIYYEAHIEHEDTASKGHYEVFAGQEIGEIKSPHHELLLKFFPPRKYAVFTFHGEKIVADWHQDIYKDWMPDSGYRPAGDYHILIYDERFKGMDKLDESAVDVLVPIADVKENEKS